MSRIVWFHPRQLMPPRGGGEFRSLGLVEGALAAGHEVLIVQPDDGPEHDAPQPAGLQVETLRLRRGLPRLLAKLLTRGPLRAPRATRGSVRHARRRIEAFEPELAIVSQVMAWPLARPLLPSCPWIYDAHNVEHELFASHLSTATTAFSRASFQVDRRRVSRAERQLVAQSSMTLAVSTGDAEGLRALAPIGSPVVVIPSSMVPPARTADPASAGPVVLFVGTLDFPPNIEAIDDLVHEVMPLVLEHVPQARLLVAGRKPSRSMRELFASRDWIEFVEDAPSLDDVYRRARCVALPFRSGSGTKLKLYESLAYGMPVVATPKAVNGVEVEQSEALVARDLVSFAECIRDLLVDEGMAKHLGRAARGAFDSRLSWERAAHPALREALERLT